MTSDLSFLSGIHNIILTPPICQHHTDAVPGRPRPIGRRKHMLGRKLYGPPSLEINKVMNDANAEVTVQVAGYSMICSTLHSKKDIYTTPVYFLPGNQCPESLQPAPYWTDADPEGSRGAACHCTAPSPPGHTIHVMRLYKPY